jgi:LmbE family N-acetylglucosaminyl deacetylase
MSNPYLRMVTATEKLLRDGAALPLGALPGPPAPPLAPDAPVVLLFAPHPDDECIIGALPLRLRRELRMNVLDVAVTQGSNPARKAARLAELQAACAYLGFGVRTTAAGGLDGVNLQCRANEPQRWRAHVAVIAGILAAQRPQAIFVPHAADANRAHIGTYHLVMDALAGMPAAFACWVLETEYWAALSQPNVMIESCATDVADLMAATACHAGEVVRNPYHLRLPAWMSDNVRRGGELIGGQGGAVPDFAFATLYRLSRWERGALTPAPGRFMIGAMQSCAALFAAPAAR